MVLSFRKYLLIMLIILGAILTGHSIVWGQGPVCSFCNEQITGRYAKWEDGVCACASCMKTLPKCNLCGKLFTQGNVDNRGKYCERCYLNATFCSICNNMIKGKFYNFGDRGAYCVKCRKRLPACARCGIPLPDGEEMMVGKDRSVFLCSRCYYSSELCHACGMPITGEYFTLPTAPDRKFCSNCRNQMDKCDFCGSPVSSENYRYADGRVSCAECYFTAVNDYETIYELEKQARYFIENVMGIKPRPKSECPIRLVSAKQLSQKVNKNLKLGKEYNPRERGIFNVQVEETSLFNIMIRQKEKLTIYIESGLPRLEAFGTIVHELTHLWQFDHFPKSVDKHWLEGLACWIQYHALQSLVEEKAYSLAQLLALNPDPIYGVGFRMVQEIEEIHGLENTIEEVLRIVKE